MSEQGTGDTISGNFSNVNNSGSIGIGKGISQVQSSNQPQPDDEAATLKQSLSKLKAQVEAEAPPEKKSTAIKRLAELEEAIFTEKPDVDRMDDVKRWFGKHLPTLAGAVTTVIVNPFVGKLVEAGGEMAAGEFRKRMGS